MKTHMVTCKHFSLILKFCRLAQKAQKAKKAQKRRRKGAKGANKVWTSVYMDLYSGKCVFFCVESNGGGQTLFHQTLKGLLKEG